MKDEGKGLLPKSRSGPGLVDLQVNGFAGFDFNSDPAGWTTADFFRVKEALEARGIVAALPTLITDDIASILARAGKYAALVGKAPELGTTFPGLHVEGPFLSPEEGPRGVHPAAHLAVPADHPGFVERLAEAAGGRVAILTLAPELEGALDLIAAAARAGILPAIGHTAADRARIREAAAAGARLAVHLGNGSHSLLPRLDNYVQAQLAEDGLHASFIADGHHVPFYTLKNFIRAKGPGRSILVTDATAGAAAPHGRYTLGGEAIEVSADGRTARQGRPGLAGSALTLDRAVVNVCLHCEVSFEDSWKMASEIPAALAGLDRPKDISVKVTPAGFQPMKDGKAEP